MVTLPRIAALGIAGALALSAAPALADDAKPDEGCAFTDRLTSWQDVDNNTIIIKMGVTHRYKVTFINDCREMRNALTARVETRPGICLSAGDRVIFGQQHGFKNICVIQSVEKLPPPPTPASALSH